MLTAYGWEEVVRQAEEVGLDGFLVKPMNPSALLNSILEAFGKKVARKKPVVNLILPLSIFPSYRIYQG